LDEVDKQSVRVGHFCPREYVWYIAHFASLENFFRHNLSTGYGNRAEKKGMLIDLPRNIT